MNKEKVELNILIFILIEGMFLLYGFKINLLNIFLGTILGIILILLFSKFKKNKFTTIILLLISLVLAFNTLLEISYFITNNLLKNYSLPIIIISLLLISFLFVKVNYHVFIRSVEIIFYFFLIIKLFSFFLTIPNINFSNFNVKLQEEIKPSIEILFISMGILYYYLVIYYLTNYKVKKRTCLFSIINPFIMKIIAILVMGRTLFYLYDYPYMNILKRIKYLDFIERMEGILSFEYLFCFFVTLVFLFLTIKKLFLNLLSKDQINKKFSYDKLSS